MKKFPFHKLIILILFFSFGLVEQSSATPFLYNLPVFNIESEKENVIDLTGYFLIKPEQIKKIEFGITDKKIINEIKFDKESLKIIVSASSKTGLTEIPFQIFTESDSAPLIMLVKSGKSTYPCEFKYSGTKGMTVSVAGDFNGWNKNADVMTENNGEYRIAMSLKPGEYKYKFVVNGNDWIPDPNNPVRSSDGFNNSVISAGNEKKINYSVVSSNRLTKQNNSDEFEFFIEISPESNNSTAYFFCGNRLLSKVSGVKTGKISVNVPEEFLNLSQQNELNNEIYKIALVIVSGDFSYYCKSYVINAVKNNPVFNWRDGILYFAFTDRFYKHDQNFEYKVKEKENERDNFHGGNFKGLTKKINEGYFSKLGINTIWISPVFQNPADKIFAGYHGYWPLNSYNIAPNFGTIEDLKELVDTAKKNNIRIMVDYVAKHVYKENPVFKEHPEYFGNFILPDGRKNEKLFDEFPLTTWFGDYLPAFNFDNNDAVKFLTDNALWLVKETGADGFRLDAVKHIQHNFFTELRKRLKYEIEIPQKKIFYMVGESMTSREKIMEYANVSEMNGQFDFPLYWDIRSVFAASQSNFKNLNASLLDSLKTYGTETIMSTMLGNHDFSRFMAYADDEFKPDSVNEQEYGWKNDVKVNNPENYKKLKLAFAFLMTVPGIPLVYYGDEFGLSGAHDPDNRRDMRFGKELSEYEKECLDFTSKIISLRNQNSAFRYGDIIPLKVENELYCYGLSYFNKKAIVLLSRNFKGSVSIELPEFFNVQKWNNVLNSTDFISENNSLKISIGEYSSLILVSEN